MPANEEASPLTRRAIDQAARELLLAQSSDWAFMISAGAMVQYAASRTKSHLLRFRELARQIEAGAVDEDWLGRLETQDNIFSQIAVASEYRHDPPAAIAAPRRHLRSVRRARRRNACASP